MTQSLLDKITSLELINKLLEEFYSGEVSRIEKGLNEKKELSSQEIAGMIDHTLLKPEATPDEIKKLCEEAKTFGFASVCVNPCYVTLCRDILQDTNVKVCTVVGFPLGASTTEVKKIEADQALKNGAQELDMVINIGMLKNKNYQYVFNDINQVVMVAKKHKAICKVIIETALLNNEEKVIACLISKEAKADFVKTSTGFSKSGATEKDVALMKYVVGPSVGVKASGGIKTLNDAKLMIKSGADRIGTSASVKIINGEN